METPQSATPATETTPAPIKAEAAVESLTHDERRAWQKTGEFPERIRVGKTPSDVPANSSPATTDADSSPAEPVEQAASTDAHDAPASEPGTPQTRRKRGNADTRIQELLDADRRHREEIARLTGQLEVLSRGPAKPDASPASSPDRPSTQAEYQRYLAMPEAPKEADFQSYAEYTAAMSLFITDQRWQEQRAAQTKTDAERTVADRVSRISTEARERIAAAQEADPDFASKVNPDLLNVQPASVRRLQGLPVLPQHELAESVMDSKYTDRLLVHFSKDEGRGDWTRLCAMPSGQRERFFGHLEARLGASSAPTPKTVSDAPTPPTVLGSRADTSDPVEAAIRAKDVGRYIREANKRELAALRG